MYWDHGGFLLTIGPLKRINSTMSLDIVEEGILTASFIPRVSKTMDDSTEMLSVFAIKFHLKSKS